MGRKNAQLLPLPPSSQIATHTLAQYPHARNIAFLLGTYPDVVKIALQMQPRGGDLCVQAGACDFCRVGQCCCHGRGGYGEGTSYERAMFNFCGSDCPDRSQMVATHFSRRPTEASRLAIQRVSCILTYRVRAKLLDSRRVILFSSARSKERKRV